jgi:hypothetical protein
MAFLPISRAQPRVVFAGELVAPLHQIDVPLGRGEPTLRLLLEDMRTYTPDARVTVYTARKASVWYSSVISSTPAPPKP